MALRCKYVLNRNKDVSAMTKCKKKKYPKTKEGCVRELKDLLKRYNREDLTRGEYRKLTSLPESVYRYHYQNFTNFKKAAGIAIKEKQQPKKLTTEEATKNHHGTVQIDARNKAVLFIGDSHLPYEHVDYLRFCRAVSKKHKCQIHLHVGDYEDNHAISFHDSIGELLSSGDELNLVIERTKAWYKAFPNMWIADSNHGSLIYRRMKSHGIPIAYIKPLNEIYNTPKWQWAEDFMIKTNKNDVYMCHGKSGTYNKLAREQGCSAVQGHFHGKFEITWANTSINERFNMFVGCGINRQSMAFAYGKNNMPQPILGCGGIDRKGNPFLEKMHLDENGRWIGEL